MEQETGETCVIVRSMVCHPSADIIWVIESTGPINAAYKGTGVKED